MPLEILNHEAFQVESLTAAYNVSTPIDLDVLNMFTVENVPSRTVNLIKSGSEIQVLEPGEIGQSPNKDTHDAESVVPVRAVRYPFENRIVPDDLTRIMSIRNKKLQAQELAVLVKSKMKRHKDNHRLTSVFSAYSALKGVVKSKSGNPLVDLHSVLGVNPRLLNLDLTNPQSDVPQKLQTLSKQNRLACRTLGYAIRKGTHIRLGADAIYSILTHASVKAFYGEDLHAKLLVSWVDNPDQISICGVTFIADENDGVADEGASYPDTDGLFAMLRAPADTIAGSTKNRECYITKKELDHEEGLEIKSRSIFLPIMRAPQLGCVIETGLVEKAA